VTDLLKLPLSVVFRPAETFRLIKQYRESFSYLPVVMLLFLVIAVRSIFIFVVHFPLAVILPKDANILLEVVKFYLPLFTWAVSSYAVSSIIGGEAMFNEILTASTFAFVPYILLAIPVAAVSRILGTTEQGLFNFMNNAVWLWVVLLFFVGVKSLHNYHLGTAIVVCLLSIFGMALIWALFVLIFALTGNLTAFIQGLILEVWMSFRYG
jgi:hypothetical protein